METDPVHNQEGHWYFWDETWGDRHGPYDTEREARSQLAKYKQVVLGEKEEDVESGGRQQITELASKHMKSVSQAVRNSLDAIQASIDELRTMVDSTEATVLMSIENHMRVSEQALKSASALAQQVEEFKNLVKQTLPEKETLDTLQRVSDQRPWTEQRPFIIGEKDDA